MCVYMWMYMNACVNVKVHECIYLYASLRVHVNVCVYV